MNLTKELYCLLEKYNIFEDYPEDLIFMKTDFLFNEYKDEMVSSRKLVMLGEEDILYPLMNLLHHKEGVSIWENNTPAAFPSSDTVFLSLYVGEEAARAAAKIQKNYPKHAFTEISSILPKEDISVLTEKGYRAYQRRHSYRTIIDSQNRNYEDPTLKRKRLENLIADCIRIKDFLACETYISCYASQYADSADRYTGFWGELSNLLGQAAKLCQQRMQRDVVINWIDALRYDELQNMPYLSALSRDSLFFENAFTVLPNTSHTLRTLLRGGLPIDDHQFEDMISTEKNSPLLQYLSEQGYQFRYYGNANNKYLDMKYCYNDADKEIWISSMNFWWQMITELTSNEGKLCVMIHNLWETHQPYQSPNWILRDIPDVDYSVLDQKLTQQITISQEYLDRQFEFYAGFLPADSIRIYMSDHGKFNEQFRDESSHTVFFIKDCNLKSRKIKEQFSYIHFKDAVQLCIDNRTDAMEELTESLIYLQEYGTYSKEHILFALRHNLYDCGYRAIRSRQDKYILKREGTELYYRLPDENYNCIDEKEYQERIAFLRKANGSYFIELSKYPFFRYTNQLNLLIEKVKQRENARIVINNQLIRRLCSNIGRDQGVALRGGGRHTIELLKVIGDMLSIVCIIDSNLENISSHLPYNKARPEQMKNYKIDIVILSSFKHRHEMRKEIENMESNYQIVDIYDYLSQNGWSLNRPYYEDNIYQEDYRELFQ